MNTIIYLDMDGVLVDLQQGLYEVLVTDIEQGLGHYQGSREKDLRKLLSYPDPKPISMQSMQDSLARKDAGGELTKWEKLVDRYKYKILGNEGADWWANLPPMNGFQTLIEECQNLVGEENVHILTAPVRSKTNSVERGKEQWVLKNTNIPQSQIHITEKKEAFAGGLFERAILIDDRTKYCDAFEQAGGFAILHTDVNKTLTELKEML